MKFIGYYNKAVLLTYLSIISAVIGMAFIVREQFSYALIALIISGICDSFDGTIARRYDRDDKAQNYGIQIDSLADTVAFLALPAFFLIHITHAQPLSVAVSTLFVLLGIVRLAWFNVSVGESSGVFHGIPVTQISLTLPLAYLLVHLLAPTALIPVLLILYTLIAVLFVANIPIPKPRGIWLYIFAILFVLTAVGIVLV